MTEVSQIYRCAVCENVVEMVHPGPGELVCCGQPMALMEEKAVDEGKEKHVPVVEWKNDKVRVAVGSEPHPMEDEHFIEWIEVVSGEHTYRRFLTPGDEPVAEFCLEKGTISARAYCNVHGLWEAGS